MKTCHYDNNQLMLYLFKETDLASLDEMKQHMNSCSHCQQQLSVIQDGFKLMQNLPSYTPSTDVILAIHDKAKRTIGNNQPKFSLQFILNQIIVPKPALVAVAAVLVLVVCGLFSFNNNQNVSITQSDTTQILTWIDDYDASLSTLVPDYLSKTSDKSDDVQNGYVATIKVEQPNDYHKEINEIQQSIDYFLNASPVE